MGDSMRHEALVGAALRRLGRGQAAPTDIRLLAGGQSGSSVYRLSLAGEDVVLKVTLPGEHRWLMERARREALFYRDIAGRVPVSVPRVLGFDLDEAEGGVLLLAASEPSPSPDGWTERDFVEVTRLLGCLHASFWGGASARAMAEWLRPRPQMTLARCQHAAMTWRALGDRDNLREAVEQYLPKVERLLEEIPGLELHVTLLPVTLCHGDCHTDNLLRGPDGEWVWADWQEVRLGPGVDDLAFLWTRAFAATDTSPPYEAMVRAYGAGLEEVGDVLINPVQLARELNWAELRLWLVDWPGYLGFLPVTRVGRVLRRIDTLIDRLEVEGSR